MPMPSPLRYRVVPGLLALGLGLAACGGGTGPGDTVEAMYEGIASGDTKKACDQLTPEAEEVLAEDPSLGKGSDDFLGGGAGSCQNALKLPEGDERRNAAGRVKVTDVKEEGAKATVIVEAEDPPKGTEESPEINLRKNTAGDWKISEFPGARE